MMNNAQSGNVDGHYTIASKMTDIATGKEDANFSTPQGKYLFLAAI